MTGHTTEDVKEQVEAEEQARSQRAQKIKARKQMNKRAKNAVPNVQRKVTRANKVKPI